MEKKTEKEGIFTLLNPKNLQKEIDEYGYNFSIGRYLAFIVAAVAIAAGCGLVFSLKWYFAMLTAIAGILCLPSLILSGYKNMYEHKRFLDVSDYMEQILYSFKGTNKILHALKDTQTLYEAGGKMHSTIQRAVEYVENGKEETDLYQEALSIIEDEYPCKRLRAIHEYLKSVEENGGDNDITIDLLLQDKAIWADNIILLQEDKKAARTKITLSIAVTIILALIFHAVYRSMPPQYSIVQNMATQVTTTTYLALNIFIFRRANKELSKSWIDREETDDAKTMRYYKMVTEYDEKKSGRKACASQPRSSLQPYHSSSLERYILPWEPP